MAKPKGILLYIMEILSAHVTTNSYISTYASNKSAKNLKPTITTGLATLIIPVINTFIK